MLNVIYAYQNNQTSSQNAQEGSQDAGLFFIHQEPEQQSSENYYELNINNQSPYVVNNNSYQYIKLQQYSTTYNDHTVDDKIQCFTSTNNLGYIQNEQLIQNQVNTQLDGQHINWSFNNLANEFPLEDNYFDQFLNNQEIGQQQLIPNLLQQGYQQEDQYQYKSFDHKNVQQCQLDYQQINQYYFDQGNQLTSKEGSYLPSQQYAQQALFSNRILSSNKLDDTVKDNIGYNQQNVDIINHNFQVRGSEQNIVSQEVKILNLVNYCQNNTKSQIEIINNQQINECHHNLETSPQNNNSIVSESYQQQYNYINNSIDKKNVVKNIMNQFKSFVLINKECYSEIDQTKKGFQKNLKSLFSLEEITSKNEQIVSIYNQFKQKQETLQQIQKKFERYIKSKSFNNYSLILLIQHHLYKFIFKYFLNNYAKLWLERSKINNIDSHIQIIDFLLDSFSNPEILSILKKHDKKKSVYS
ncbi:hypothetical protein TTHERM_00151290 (macronuclear) [Tetrahymena thermophila SB210]|uniref:Uncharacterized protein n=1 Tax=Tetrahymena thermophila (strain SB210) TaxID=312017 RepID=I7M2W3_TETTS|nr:hypothetical protein TTHERM_00151290 [Tetrahymena thermophila SB210]EAS01419.2 hypothetical protein TTHERM_00151290 [Tetrahymena thermophila SB210]|eukprot:XP_001021665.2 hypothetical protein TTHERM_00151290 [Tetrahymena thermophila SB210]